MAVLGHSGSHAPQLMHSATIFIAMRLFLPWDRLPKSLRFDPATEGQLQVSCQIRTGSASREEWAAALPQKALAAV